jgi:hypothetical protein
MREQITGQICDRVAVTILNTEHYFDIVNDERGKLTALPVDPDDSVLLGKTGRVLFTLPRCASEPGISYDSPFTPGAHLLADLPRTGLVDIVTLLYGGKVARRAEKIFTNDNALRALISPPTKAPTKAKAETRPGVSPREARLARLEMAERERQLATLRREVFAELKTAAKSFPIWNLRSRNQAEVDRLHGELVATMLPNIGKGWTLDQIEAAYDSKQIDYATYRAYNKVAEAYIRAEERVQEIARDAIKDHFDKELNGRVSRLVRAFGLGPGWSNATLPKLKALWALISNNPFPAHARI